MHDCYSMVRYCTVSTPYKGRKVRYGEDIWVVLLLPTQDNYKLFDITMTSLLCKHLCGRRKPGLVDSKLDSRLKGRGFESHPILDKNGVKTMPGWLKYPILDHSMIEKKENTGSQMGHTKNKIFKNIYVVNLHFRI